MFRVNPESTFEKKCLPRGPPRLSMSMHAATLLYQIKSNYWFNVQTFIREDDSEAHYRLHGPSMACLLMHTGHFWPTKHLQMRRPEHISTIAYSVNETIQMLNRKE